MAKSRNFPTSTIPEMVAPVSLSSEWCIVRDAGEMTTADAAAIVNPGGSIDTTNVYEVTRSGDVGTLILVRLKYAGTPSQDPKVAVFGRTSTSEGWQRLYNKASSPANQATLTTGTATDVTDGTYKWTEVTTSHQFDCMGCKIFRFGLELAYTVSAGSAATALLEAKII